MFSLCSLRWRRNRFNSITLQVHGTWCTMTCEATVYPGAAHSVRSSWSACSRQRRSRSSRVGITLVRSSLRQELSGPLPFSIFLPITDTWSPHMSAQLFRISPLASRLPTSSLNSVLCSYTRGSRSLPAMTKDSLCKRGTFQNKTK